MISRPKITEVFTPRSSEVNSSMYVARPFLEKLLKRGLNRNSHLLISGESGNGKSWLFKKVLTDENIPFVVANSGNASRLGSVTSEICNCIISPGTVTKLGFSEEKAAEIGAMLARGSLKHSGQYQLAQEEPLLKAFRLFSKHSARKKIIVLDNLESIFSSEELMDELADIILLLDDARYAECNVNLLIVGIPHDVLRYFRITKNAESVANRIMEIDPVTGLEKKQVDELVKKGFAQLRISITESSRQKIVSHIYDITLGIAQRVHEYCEWLACAVEENDWKYNADLLELADSDWLHQSLRNCYQAIEGHLNSRETTVARRNQVIFCIGKISTHQFDSSNIDSMIRREFPGTVARTGMGIGSILNDLSSGDLPLLTRNERNNNYVIRDPRYLMCIRMMLYKRKEDQKVAKKNFVR